MRWSLVILTSEEEETFVDELGVEESREDNSEKLGLGGVDAKIVTV